MKRQAAKLGIPRANTSQRQARLRRLPRVKFVQWAVRTLGGKWQSGWECSRGFQGQIIPAHSEFRAASSGEPLHHCPNYPIQVKQKDKAGRPDIDQFETAMRRAKCAKGFFVSFAFSDDALREIQRFFVEEHAVIVPLTVQEILEEQIGMKLV